MSTFYVRPQREAGYGSGDGTSHENAWNGFAAIDWDVLLAQAPATILVCGGASGRERVIALRVDARASLKKAA